MDADHRYANNTTYFLPTNDPWLAAVLNSPIAWAYAWRRAQHGKDEALRYFSSFVEGFPIPPEANPRSTVDLVSQIRDRKALIDQADHSMKDWLRYEIGLQTSIGGLSEPHVLDVEQFVAAIRKALPRSRKLSAADIGRIKTEHAATLGPARIAMSDVSALEKRLSDAVNVAYGLTTKDVTLMWKSAPPRMP